METQSPAPVQVRRESTVAAPAISVVMPVLDPDPRQLRQAVESLRAQTFADFELLVIEDPGRSATAVAEVLAAVGDGRTRHLRNPRRTSLVEQRNQGLWLARGDLVAMLDADDICAPTRLRAQIDFLAAHPEVALVGSQILIMDEETRVWGRRGYPLDHDSIVRAMRRYSPLAHSSVMARRRVLIDVGGYDDCGRRVAEDYDLWCRLARRGARFANMPEPLLLYRIHDRSSKRREVHATLRETISIKRRYWSAEFGLMDNLRLWAERALLWLPPALVLMLFRRLVLRRR